MHARTFQEILFFFRRYDNTKINHLLFFCHLDAGMLAESYQMVKRFIPFPYMGGGGQGGRGGGGVSLVSIFAVTADKESRLYAWTLTKEAVYSGTGRQVGRGCSSVGRASCRHCRVDSPRLGCPVTGGTIL